MVSVASRFDFATKEILLTTFRVLSSTYMIALANSTSKRDNIILICCIAMDPK